MTYVGEILRLNSSRFAGGLAVSAGLRPGGEGMIRRIAEILALSTGGRVADIGCGKGESVAILRSEFGLDAVGVDIAPANENIICADASELPFEDGRFDALVFECSLSVMDRPEKALSEAWRVLRQGGLIAVADVFARGESMAVGGALGRVSRWNEIHTALVAAGFELLSFEELSEVLRQLWAELIFEHGDGAAELLGTDTDALRAARPGYFVALLRRGADRPGQEFIQS